VKTSYKHNSFHLARKYVRIFVLGCHLFLKAHSFPRTTLLKTCSLPGTDNVRGEISEHIFAPNGHYFLYIFNVPLYLEVSVENHLTVVQRFFWFFQINLWKQMRCSAYIPGWFFVCFSVLTLTSLKLNKLLSMKKHILCYDFAFDFFLRPRLISNSTRILLPNQKPAILELFWTGAVRLSLSFSSDTIPSPTHPFNSLLP